MGFGVPRKHKGLDFHSIYDGHYSSDVSWLDGIGNWSNSSCVSDSPSTIKRGEGFEHERIAPVGVWLIAALHIVAGYSALAPALLSPISRILNVPELSHIPNVLLFAFGVSLLTTAFGVITMKKRWFYITIGLSALSIGVFSWVPLFSLFPILTFYPDWLVAVSPWPVEMPVMFYLIWKRDNFLKDNGGKPG